MGSKRRTQTAQIIEELVWIRWILICGFGFLAGLLLYGCSDWSEPTPPPERGDFSITVEFDCEATQATAGVLRAVGDGTFWLDMGDTVEVAAASHTWTFPDEQNIAWWGFAVDFRCYFDSRQPSETSVSGGCSDATPSTCQELLQ